MAVDAVGATPDGSATTSEGSAQGNASADSRVPEPTLHLTWHESQNGTGDIDDLEDAFVGEGVVLSSQIPV